MSPEEIRIVSPANPRVKAAVKLRQRSHRDETGLMLIEGYREILRALQNNHPLTELFYCRELFLGKNEDSILERCRAAGIPLRECAESVFAKLAYRDRPEGLLAVAPQLRRSLQDLSLPVRPLLVVVESIEKPGNLGTILRSADAAGADAVIVCDRCTDINNPNVVRASLGVLFAIPVAEASTAETVSWLQERKIQMFAASPHADTLYTHANFTLPTAIVLGSEQYGLSEAWMRAATLRIKIPMLGQSDSLNVAAAATILLYEAVRQRSPE